jgi:pimeloyl-ACP methyl ester carboxylesterase
MRLELSGKGRHALRRASKALESVYSIGLFTSAYREPLRPKLEGILGAELSDKQSPKRQWSDRQWQSPDGLTLHFRDYEAAPPKGRPPVICLHGLTRNARDFEDLAPFIADKGWRVLALDMRGRGKSAYAPDSASYAVPTYVGDVLALLEQEQIPQFISVGTSMGGLITMALAALAPERLAGAVINDIGPEIETAGLDAIKGYVGQARSFATWMHAARALQEVQQANFPQFSVEDWLVMAKRCMVLHANGRIAFDYDMSIAEPILNADAAAAPPDLWPAFGALAQKPLMLIRGALSGLLAEKTFTEMQRRSADAMALVVPETGHAPTLDEPEVREAMARYLDKLA